MVLHSRTYPLIPKYPKLPVQSQTPLFCRIKLFTQLVHVSEQSLQVGAHLAAQILLCVSGFIRGPPYSLHLS